MMRALAVDFETANEKRSSPCAVGLAFIEDGVVVRREYRLIRPLELRFSPWNVKVHGIEARDVTSAPEFPEAMAEFLPAFAQYPILAHNAGFDIGVLAQTLALYGRPVPALTYLCTRDVARAAWPSQPGFGLASVARFLGIAFEHHHAGEDAFACARVAIAAAETAGARGIDDLASRLGLQPRRRVGGPLPGAGIAARAAAAPRSAADRPHAHLSFTVRGSTGNAYEVSARSDGAGYRPSCTCVAGRMNRVCRHVKALLDGVVDDLLTDNAGDLPAFVRLVGEGAPARRAGA